jgi:membrane protein
MLLAIRCFVQKLADDRMPTLAALVAWSLFNTVLPLLLGIPALLYLILGNAPQVAGVVELLLRLLPEDTSAALRATLESAQSSAAAAGVISVLLLLLTASNLFTALESVFDLAYCVPERPLVMQRVVGLGTLVLVSALLLASTTLAMVAGDLGSVVSLATLIATFVALYTILPNKAQSVRHSLPGAVLATVLLLAGLRIFPLYVALFGQGFNLYAALGSVLLFAFWLYLVGLIIVGGVELNAYLEAPRRSSHLASIASRARAGQLDL